MSAPVSSLMVSTMAPPVMAARRWLDGVRLPADLPLINVSQAAPMLPPPAPLCQAMAEAILSETSAHLYGPDLGNPALREALAARTSALYGARIAPAQVAITGGCNMAFTAVMATLCEPGDEILLPVPWYFNHAMWAQMNGVGIRPLPCDAAMIPDLAAAEALITERTRAIVLVTPNNPTGAEYPAATLAGFRDLARRHGVALVVDETYRDFHSAEGAPHDLFTDPDWDDTLIQLYSFSKAYRLTGHRCGAILSSPARLAEVEKYIDTVAICAAQPGQIGALWGLRHLGDWLEGERHDTLERGQLLRRGIADLPGWRLLEVGAYFAYLEHPFAMSAPDLAQAMLREIGVLALPGTFFRPEGDARGHREMRIAFANLDQNDIPRLLARLAALPFPLAAAAQAG